MDAAPHVMVKHYLWDLCRAGSASISHLGWRTKPPHCHYLCPLVAHNHTDVPQDTLTLAPDIGSHAVEDDSSMGTHHPEVHHQARPSPRLSPRVLTGIPHPYQTHHLLQLEVNNYLIPPTSTKNQQPCRNGCSLTSHRTQAIYCACLRT